MPDDKRYFTRSELCDRLTTAWRESDLSQTELADRINKRTGLSVKQPNVSKALKAGGGKFDYLREHLAEELLGGSWKRGRLFWRED